MDIVEVHVSINVDIDIDIHVDVEVDVHVDVDVDVCRHKNRRRLVHLQTGGQKQPIPHALIVHLLRESPANETCSRMVQTARPFDCKSLGYSKLQLLNFSSIKCIVTDKGLCG